MYEYIRNLRHNKLFSHILIWKILGYCFGKVVESLPFNFAIKQNITQNFTFKMHVKFAFSNFKEWGNKHNNFFYLYVKKAKKIKCFLDVGSHIGIVTLPIAKAIHKSGQVYSFEPSSKNLFFLKYHLKINKIKNVKVIESVVSSETKSNFSFYESEAVTGMNSIIPLKDKKIINHKKIQSISLDHFCIENSIIPDFIKVDTEGAEIELLIGSKVIIKKYQPIFFLSYHPNHIKKLGYKNDDFFKIVDKLKYKIYDQNFERPREMKNSEYLIVPKSLNIKKFINDN